MHITGSHSTLQPVMPLTSLTPMLSQNVILQLLISPNPNI